MKLKFVVVLALVLLRTTTSWAAGNFAGGASGGQREQPVRRTFFVPNPSAVSSAVVGTFQCLDTILFPANFAGNWPDANASAACGTAPGASNTYTFKINGSTAGQVVLTGSNAITEVNEWNGAASASASSTTINTSGGTQMQANDVCVVSMEFYNAVSFSSITGGANGTWTAVYTVFQNTNNLTKQGSFYHVASAGDIGATFTVTWSAGAFSLPTMTCYRNVNTSAPICVSGTGDSSSGAGTSATATGINTSGCPSAAVVYVAGVGASSTLTVPPGFSQRWNQVWVNNTNQGSMGADLIGSYASGTAESGTLGTSTNWTAVLFALAPTNAGACTPTFTTTGGLPQTCLAGQTFETDGGASLSGANINFTLAGHVQ